MVSRLANTPGDQGRHYKFGFVLSTSLGNETRYQNLRKYADRDPEVDFTWAPVKHFIAQGEPDPFRGWPGPIRSRAIVMHQSAPVLRALARLDAVMYHLYEVEILTALRSYWAASPLRIISSDQAPALDPAKYPMHPVDAAKPAWRRSIRHKIDIWRYRRADLLIPFSKWAGSLTEQAASIPNERIKPVHVGVDLELWECHTKEAVCGRPKVLFCGGDFQRKGGQHLLEAFTRHLSELAELHLITRSAPSALPANVHVHDDLVPNDPRLRQLFRDADLLVHPTLSDVSSWVTLEAMASGLPTITTPVGGIPELVEEGKTGFIVPTGDVEALAAAIRTLTVNPELRRHMGRNARARIEAHFSAAINVPRILSYMKELVDDRRIATRT